MKPFPEQWELVSLFEGEPTLADPGVIWFYNRVTFSLARHREQIECVLEPASRTMSFRWLRDGRALVDLAVGDVVALRTYAAGDAEGLLASLQDPAQGALQIQISPEVSVSWRVNQEA